MPERSQDPLSHGLRLALISLQVHCASPFGPLRSHGVYDLAGSVGAAVVDEQKLDVMGRDVKTHESINVQTLFLVVAWHNDLDIRHRDDLFVGGLGSICIFGSVRIVAHCARSAAGMLFTEKALTGSR